MSEMLKMRQAGPQDIAVITALRMQMLREVAGDVPEGLPEQIAAYLARHLEDGSCLCMLLEDKGHTVAEAMLCIYEVMPDESNTTGRAATLYSVYTLPAYRGHGLMERLLNCLFETAHTAGVREVLAHAEASAIPLYARLGFAPLDREMHLFLS